MTSQEPTARRAPNVVLLVVIGVALIGVIAVLLTRGGGDDAQTTAAAAETRSVSVVGNALPSLEDPASDAAIGEQAPVLSGETFAGDSVTVGKPGTPQLIVFLAHWCPHCQREVPVLVGWLEENGVPEGVDLYAVATSIDAAKPNYPPSKWLEREGWTITTLVDAKESTASAAYGLSGFPFFVALHADGTVAARASGELDASQLESLLKIAKA